MEEKKQETKKQTGKISYDELRKLAGELSANYQKLQQAYEALRGRYDEAVEALNDRDFQYHAFFLDKLFKVVESPAMFKPEFVDWCAKTIEDAIMAFDASGNPSDKVGEAKEENNEAE